MRERVFAILLRFFPRDFQSRLGPDLRATARALDRDTPVTWIKLGPVIADAIATLLTVRREMRAEARPTSPLRNGSWIDGIGRDFVIAFRGLRRDSLFTTFVIATLMLGIGANAAMFGLADRLLLRGPALVRDPSRVVRFYLTAAPPGRRVVSTDEFGHVTYDLMTKASASFESVASYAVDTVLVGRGDGPYSASGGYCSANLFGLLGVAPAAGRLFSDDENRPGRAAHVAVLSDAAWKTWFAGAPDIVGRSITVGADRYEIVGVAPVGFTGPQLGRVDLWMPINLIGPRTTETWQTSWTAQWLYVIGRLRPGITFDRASEEATGLYRAGYTGPRPYMHTARMFVAPLTANDEGVEGLKAAVLRWMWGVALIVLLIACANVANLLLARGMRRSREVAIRAALGAGRARLVRLLLVESLLLSTAGAAAGIGVAYSLSRLARSVVFSWVDWSGSPVDLTTVGIAAGLALAVGLVIGAVPAWRATRTASVADSLKSGAREGGGPKSRLRHSLTVAQAALSVMLLIGAGLFVRSLWHAQSLHLGFDPDRILSIEISRPGLSQITDASVRDAERARRHDFPLDALDRLRAIPGVAHASLAVGMPFGNRFTVDVHVPGIDVLPQGKGGPPSVSAVGPDYFATVGTRVVRGRGFTPADRAGSEPIAIVNELMAGTIWPGEDPIGRCVQVGNPPGPCARVVGVAENTYISSLREDASMHYYIPFGQEKGWGGTQMLVRAADPAAVAPAVKRVLTELDSTIGYVSTETIKASIDPQTRPWRIGAAVFSLSGLLAALVAAIGIYSVTSYLVADRRREIGVRVALGAKRSDVARLVVGTSAGMAAVGALFGCAGALAGSRYIDPLLFDESARDPWVHATVGVLLLGVALVAAIIPAMRANRIDPLEALRAE